jgi:RHS repeat-associated protein
LLEDSSFTYTYDENGNLTRKTSKANGELTTYTYDAENQLIRVDRPGIVAEYRYDALGRRIEKVVNGVSTRYIYDNEDIAVEADGSGTAQAFYLHGPGIDEPLSMVRFGAGGGHFAYHADGLGSISTLTDLNGNPVRSYTYDSFGRLVAQTGTVTNPYTYTGRELDPESGLFYYRARYYDPTMGRFLQEDPIALLGGVNFYSYVKNNPIKFIDPEGLLVSSTVLKVLNPIVTGAQATAQELALQAKLVDAGLGGVALLAEPLLPPNVTQAQIPGLGGATVGDVLDLTTGYGGLRTLSLAGQLGQGTVGLTAAISSVPAGFTVGLVLLTGLGSFEFGTAVNDLSLNNPRFFPCGNPVEKLFFDLFFRQSVVTQTRVGF